MRLKSLLISAGLSMLVFTAFAFSQKSSIEGNVADGNGRPVKGAAVRIQEEKTNSAAIVAKTDAKGHFIAPDLPAGMYNVAVLVSGTVKWSMAHMKATSGQVARLNLGGRQVADAAAKRKTRAVWVPERTGSRLGGHWEDQPDRAPGANDVDTMSTEQLRRIQNVPPAVSASGGR